MRKKKKKYHQYKAHQKLEWFIRKGIEYSHLGPMARRRTDCMDLSATPPEYPSERPLEQRGRPSLPALHHWSVS